jgi:hypothetical protein
MPYTLVKAFDVTIPPGTAANAPLVTLTQFEANTVTRIDWLFPDGCNGQVGIAIGSRAVPVIPGTTGSYFIRSGDSGGYDLSDMHTTGDWSVIGYNTGQYPHTIHVSFTVHRTVKPVKPPTLVLSIPDIIGMGES